jgi:hypothetical protein
MPRGAKLVPHKHTEDRIYTVISGQRRSLMKRIALLLLAVATVAGVFAMTTASGQSGGAAAPTFGIKIPPGYRDWKLIAVAHEEGNLKSLGAILGNDVAIQAYRERRLPFPVGTIIAALHWSHVASEENNTGAEHAT